MPNIQMWHPNVPGTKESPVTRTRRQFDDSFKAVGWRLWPPKKTTKTTAAQKGDTE